MRIVRIAVAIAAVLAFAPLADAQMGGGMSPTPSGPSGPDPQVTFAAGVAAINAHNYEEAIRQLRMARTASPQNATIGYTLGLAYEGAGNKEEAQRAYERAARQRNAPPQTWLQLGLVSLALGDREKATAQQTALETQISRCNDACGDARRTQLQSAHDRLATALAASPAATP